MGLTPIPFMSGLKYLTPSPYGTLLLVHLALAILPILPPPNQSNAARK